MNIYSRCGAGSQRVAILSKRWGAKGPNSKLRAGREKGSGDPGKTRTSDTQFRKLLLYPPELRGHFKINKLQTARICWVTLGHRMIF